MQGVGATFRSVLPASEWRMGHLRTAGVSGPIPLDRLVEAYLLACRTEGMSSNTIRWYGQKLAAFLDHLRGSGVAPIALTLMPDIVRAFVAFLQAQGLSAFTVRGYVRVLKGFATWLVEDWYLERHPLGKLALPRVPANVVKPLDDAEVAALLRAVNRRSYRGSRDLALLLLLLDTGMRLGDGRRASGGGRGRSDTRRGVEGEG